MPPVISFIGWHNAGKSTLASQVVARLIEKGYSIAVIKSTKERGMVLEPPHTDTSRYKAAGAESVALLAPDQLIVQSTPPDDMGMFSLAQKLFPEVDIVVIEGGKYAVAIPKIEVRRADNPPMPRDQVSGIIATVTDLPLPTDDLCFRFDQVAEITELITTRFQGIAMPSHPSPKRHA
jgi:molybdopterin-guanine dinucleotide biosynthesis protein B